jgi:AraC-like DNA-binding protein
MTPGALLLGRPGQCFECGHEHASGDRCLSFGYTPEYFERIAADAGFRGAKADFDALRVPPLRDLAPLIARACGGLAGLADLPWEELSVELAARTVQVVGGLSQDSGSAPPGAVARVTRAVRAIERDAGEGPTLASLAEKAGLSPFHFLRTFERLTGVTPHQYILRQRLRNAALRLATDTEKIVNIALDCGFGDLSNFNRAFRAEFGVSPRAYRRLTASA